MLQYNNMKKLKRGFPRLKYLSGISLRPIAMPLLVAVSSLGLLGYKLFSLVPFGQIEQAANLGSATMSAIKNDILFAPVKGLQIFILKFTENDVYIRLASVAVAAAAAILLYLMLRKWYTTRVSLLTSLMFITSSWFLQQGRSANLDVLYLAAAPAVLLALMWFIAKKPSPAKVLIGTILIGMALYTPGVWLFIIFGLVILRGPIAKSLPAIDTNVRLMSSAAFIITLLPLLYSFIIKPGQVIRWLGFDTGQEFTVQTIGANFLAIPTQLLFTGPDDQARWLVGTPVFDLVTITMVILGLYAYRTGYYVLREKLIFGSIIIAVLLIGLGNVAALSLLLPLLYLTVANGIAYLLQSWFTVFPRNPVARPIGVALLVIVVSISAFYHIHRYFKVWPNADATTQALERNF